MLSSLGGSVHCEDTRVHYMAFTYSYIYFIGTYLTRQSSNSLLRIDSRPIDPPLHRSREAVLVVDFEGRSVNFAGDGHLSRPSPRSCFEAGALKAEQCRSGTTHFCSEDTATVLPAPIIFPDHGQPSHFLIASLSGPATHLGPAPKLLAQ
jgi:hypothetical protein